MDKCDLADPVLEGVRGGEEQAAVQTQDHNTRELLVAGVLVQLPEHLSARLPSQQGHGGRVATEMSQSSDSPIPIITPASTPNTSVPAMAAIAIQKSKRCTLARRRISGTSIMPMTTASMIRAASRAPDIAARLRDVAGLLIWSFSLFRSCRCVFWRHWSRNNR